eukprot:CAMPEP_0113682674 /NCGR_PEP_ID=MMETSP0038_2-20120614/12811_1 /TAXON_ID=2898 /ORGANISM="Cryptomonas paramecium" /LENGTH=169 /DNA_ID=CAMNT_0000601803 /DNA_START=319 /DNA_END=828 /DNA_ORIENTATION=- /assembly_acc=CAM_ASM_000170
MSRLSAHGERITGATRGQPARRRQAESVSPLAHEVSPARVALVPVAESADGGLWRARRAGKKQQHLADVAGQPSRPGLRRHEAQVEQHRAEGAPECAELVAEAVLGADHYDVRIAQHRRHAVGQVCEGPVRQRLPRRAHGGAGDHRLSATTNRNQLSSEADEACNSKRA